MCEQLTLQFVKKWLGPIHNVTGMIKFATASATSHLYTLMASDVEGHSAEGLTSRNQYAKRAIDLRCANSAAKSFKCKTLQSASATATPEYSRVGQMTSLSKSYEESGNRTDLHSPNLHPPIANHGIGPNGRRDIRRFAATWPKATTAMLIHKTATSMK